MYGKAVHIADVVPHGQELCHLDLEQFELEVTAAMPECYFVYEYERINM